MKDKGHWDNMDDEARKDNIKYVQKEIEGLMDELPDKIESLMIERQKRQML